MSKQEDAYKEIEFLIGRMAKNLKDSLSYIDTVDRGETGLSDVASDAEAVIKQVDICLEGQ